MDWDFCERDYDTNFATDFVKLNNSIWLIWKKFKWVMLKILQAKLQQYMNQRLC